MNARDRFKQICRFERCNDPFLWGVAAWNETLGRWLAEGMPVTSLDDLKQVLTHFIGYQDQKEQIRPKGAISGMGKNGNPPWVVAIDPVFERKVLSDDGEHETMVDYDGTIVQRSKGRADAIPHYLEYPVKDRATWECFKKRLDPDSPGRWPEGWEVMSESTLGFPLREGQTGKSFEERDFPLGMNLLSLYGNPRNYMGLENLSMAIYDDISLVEEMIDWQAHLAYRMAKRVFDAGITLEWVWIWEDMCCKTGSLVSPAFVERYMVPRYRKVVDLLRDHGVDALIVDCDGSIDELLPIWIDAGINATYPLECASGMDGRRVRERFGNNVILCGNVDKRALAEGKNAIDREVDKVKSLLAHGGCLPSVDHHVPPDVPYRNMVYFVNEVRKLSAFPETRRVIA